MSRGTCSVAVCDLPVHGRGLCTAHYARMLANGAPGETAVRHVLQDTESRILARVKVDADTGCWVWQGYLNPGGYGTLCVDGRKQLTHRALYEAVVAPIPDGMPLDHICWNTACCRPDHLRVVTTRQNAQRARKKSGMTSRYRGVSWAEAIGRTWRAQCHRGGKNTHIGYFKDEWMAAVAAHEVRLTEGVFGETEYWDLVLADRDARGAA